jgi:hypothetical protein
MGNWVSIRNVIKNFKYIRMTLMNTTFHLIRCGRYPGVYTFVYKYISWVNKNKAV